MIMICRFDMILLFVDSAVIQNFVIRAIGVLIIVVLAVMAIIVICMLLSFYMNPKMKAHQDIIVTEQPIPYDENLVDESEYIIKVATGSASAFWTNTFPIGYRSIDEPCSYGHGKLVKTPRELYELYTRYKFVKTKEEKDKE